MDIKSQRRALLKARHAMPDRIRQEKSVGICQHLNSWDIFKQSKTTLAYCSFNGEPDLSTLLTQQRSWGLPRCQGKTLIWHRWYPTIQWPLSRGTYGITEPHPDSPLVEPFKVDLILVTCLACDINGYRHRLRIRPTPSSPSRRLGCAPRWHLHRERIVLQMTLTHPSTA